MIDTKQVKAIIVVHAYYCFVYFILHVFMYMYSITGSAHVCLFHNNISTWKKKIIVVQIKMAVFVLLWLTIVALLCVEAGKAQIGKVKADFLLLF